MRAATFKDRGELLSGSNVRSHPGQATAVERRDGPLGVGCKHLQAQCGITFHERAAVTSTLRYPIVLEPSSMHRIIATAVCAQMPSGCRGARC